MSAASSVWIVPDQQPVDPNAAEKPGGAINVARRDSYDGTLLVARRDGAFSGLVMLQRNVDAAVDRDSNTARSGGAHEDGADHPPACGQELRTECAPEDVSRKPSENTAEGGEGERSCESPVACPARRRIRPCSAQPDRGGRYIPVGQEAGGSFGIVQAAKGGDEYHPGPRDRRA